jgi:hypothetical protein
MLDRAALLLSSLSDGAPREAIRRRFRPAKWLAVKATRRPVEWELSQK